MSGSSSTFLVAWYITFLKALTHKCFKRRRGGTINNGLAEHFLVMFSLYLHHIFSTTITHFIEFLLNILLSTYPSRKCLLIKFIKILPHLSFHWIIKWWTGHYFFVGGDCSIFLLMARGIAVVFTGGIMELHFNCLTIGFFEDYILCSITVKIYLCICCRTRDNVWFCL